MRKLLLLLFAFISINATAQEPDLDNVPYPNWSWGYKTKTAKVGDIVEVYFRSDNVFKDYYIYANDFDEYLGPLLFEFDFKNHSSYQLVGKPTAVGAHKHYDDVWEGDVKIFEDGKAQFIQKIKILSENPVIKGSFRFSMCSTISGECKSPRKEKFEVKGLTVIGNDANQVADTEDTATKTTIDTAESAIPSTTPEVEDDGNCVKKEFDGKTEQAPPSDEQESYWAIFLIAFVEGLAGLLTPCVFPMIPMTVSFFLKGSENRAKAIRTGIIYAISIVVIYVIIGTVVALAFGAAAPNFLSTHWIPNLFFFIIFIVFAASFLGMFEIVMPNSIVSAMDKKADKGGLIGVFFMAFTLVLVSFSCTGPLVGTVLVMSANGSWALPMVGMLGFSLAFALPFGLFAIFPSLLSGLPKSGGWLNSVKVVLGFLELALAFKFLSIADQTYHWGILDREIYIAIWIVIAILLGMYLIGKLKFSHDSDMPYLKVPRMGLGIVSFVFALYLLPGMFGASLPGMAGYLPPISTHSFNLPGIIEKATAGEGELCEEPLYPDLREHIPQGLNGYVDYEQGIRCAKAIGKPVLLDFTGHGCVNCRKMEATAWVDPAVHKILSEKYIIVSLYVDDRTKLAEEDWKTSKLTGDKLKTIGEVNADLQECLFSKSSQPWYVLMDPNDENLLEHPRGAKANGSDASNFDVPDFIDFLNSGLKLYNQKHPELKEKK